MKNVPKDEDLRFGFGQNWADYVEKHFSEEKVRISQNHLLDFLKLKDLEGQSFLDVGCGSGLHSLAAWKAGAASVVSFDFDENSVKTTRKLKEMSGNPKNWTVLQGSVLDLAFLTSLEKASIVYSWGVLHHTGSMWKAIENVTHCMREDSIFYMALYSKDVHVSPPYQYWLQVKRAYNAANRAKRGLMEMRYGGKILLVALIRQGKNPIKYIREYQRSRGMSFWHDVKDWLGGYPMEFAGNVETEKFCSENLGLELINQSAGEGNTEYLFKKRGSQIYWDRVVSSLEEIQIRQPFEHVGGHAWKTQLEFVGNCDPDKFMLYENNKPIGWPNASRDHIEVWGRGRYTLEGNMLFLSTTENKDPNGKGLDFSFRINF